MEGIREAMARFRADNKLKGLAGETVVYYDTMLSIMIKKTGIKYVSQFNQKFVDDYKIFLMENQKSTASVNTHLRAIKRFKNFLGLDIVVHLIRDNSLPKPTYDQSEIDKIIKSATPDDEDSVIAILLASTGIRSKSLRNIFVSDISFDDETLIIRHTKCRHPYILPLPAMVVDLLSRYIKLQRLRKTDLLFPSCSGTQMTRWVLLRHIERFWNRIGIDNSGIHKFRHTFAKIECQNGLNDAIALSHMLGQNSIQIAERYVNLYGNELRNPMIKYNPIQ